MNLSDQYLFLLFLLSQKGGTKRQREDDLEERQFDEYTKQFNRC